MKKTMFFFALMAAALCLGCKAEEEITPGPTPKPASPDVIVNNQQVAPEHTIEVTGYGEVIATPDYATITLGVTGSAENAEQANQKCEANLAGVYEVAKNMGVQDADFTDSGIAITAQQRESDGAITGYHANVTVIITAHDVSTANAVTSGIIDASLCELKSTTYSLTDATAAYKEALIAAMADAAQKAQTLAEAGQVSLGAVIGVKESLNEDSKLAGVDFQTSAIAVPAKVTVTYFIK